MASQGNDSVAEGLKKVFTQISQLKLLPDAGQHIQFISLLEQAIMKYLQQQASQAAGVGQAAQGQSDGGQPGGAPGAPSGMPPAPGPAGFAPGGGAGGGMPGVTQMPNPDELRRVLAGAGGQ